MGKKVRHIYGYKMLFPESQNDTWPVAYEDCRMRRTVHLIGVRYHGVGLLFFIFFYIFLYFFYLCGDKDF